MIYSIFSFLLPELFSFVGKRLIGKMKPGKLGKTIIGFKLFGILVKKCCVAHFLSNL